MLQVSAAVMQVNYLSGVAESFICKSGPVVQGTSFTGTSSVSRAAGNLIHNMKKEGRLAVQYT